MNFCYLLSKFNLIIRLPTRVCPASPWTWTGWGSVTGGRWPRASPSLASSGAPPPGPRCPRWARMTRGRGRSHRGRPGLGQPRGRPIPRPRNWTQTTSRGWQETGRQKSSRRQVSSYFCISFLVPWRHGSDLIEKMLFNARYVGLSDHSDIMPGLTLCGPNLSVSA